MERQWSHRLRMKQRSSEPRDLKITHPLHWVSANNNAMFRDKGDLLDGLELIVESMNYGLLSLRSIVDFNLLSVMNLSKVNTLRLY